MKTLLLILLFFYVTSTKANVVFGKVPNHKTVSNSETIPNKVSKTAKSKDIKHVFRKVKRVENILKPKKKLRKRKYTIA